MKSIRSNSNDFVLREDFANRLTEIEFISHSRDKIQIEDIFVFPSVYRITDGKPVKVKGFESMWNNGNHLMLQGDDRIGKTTMCKKLFLNCVSENIPVLMIDGHDIRSPLQHEELIEKTFREQFHGEYDIWETNENKMLIIDDLASVSRLQFIDFAKECFGRIFVTMSLDNYVAYFRDEEKLADFGVLSLRSFGHAQQETLITRWKSVNNSGLKTKSIPHGEIDRIEDSLNSIIHRSHIVPRYPFYILSILQTYEGFMPKDIQITAYGHCYQALIVAQLYKIGIEGQDIDSAFNFLTQFSFEIFDSQNKCLESDFDKFLARYKDQFIIRDSIIKSLRNTILVTRDGTFRFYYPFAYYFFLGRFFALNYIQYEDFIGRLAEKSYFRDNRYILIFTIHHTHDNSLINKILSHTKSAMDQVPVAELSARELKPLAVALDTIPERIITRRTVKSKRIAERNRRDDLEKVESDGHEEARSDQQSVETDQDDVFNSVYRSLKNMEILGQILRNKYGSFPKEKLREIVKTIADAGLRLARSATDENGITRLEEFLSERADEFDDKINKTKMKNLMARLTRTLSFYVITVILYKIVASIRKRELAEVIHEVCLKEDTPAYDLIGYLFVLQTAEELNDHNVHNLETIVGKFDVTKNVIARRLLSITTQDYLNKHTVKYQLRQKIYQHLNIEYRANSSTTTAEKNQGKRQRRKS